MKSLPMQFRAASVIPSSTDTTKRTFDVVWSTGAPVKRYDWWTDEVVSEELDLAGADLARLNSGAPVLNTHSAWSLGSVIGVVERAWIDGKEGKATVRFSQRDDVDPILRDIQDGILRNVSVGYAVNKAERIRSAKNGVPDTVRVTDFTPMEISIVAVAADVGAQVQRSQAKTFPVQLTRQLFDASGIYAKRNATRGIGSTPLANVSGEPKPTPARRALPDPAAIYAARRSR